MQKIMFYCQNLIGIGHVVVSTEIIRSLVKDFKVCLIDGGERVQGFEIPPTVETVNLPAIRSENKQLASADPSLSLEEVKDLRKGKILEVFDRFEPDCLITECFPFTKRKLLFELVPLLERVRGTGGRTKTICCLRDIVIMSKKAYSKRWIEKEAIICGLINQYFDSIFVNSDPKFQRLEENFSRVKDLACDIYYTGYVAQSPPENQEPTAEDVASLSTQEPMIVVSVGGGRMGYELLETIVKSSPILEKHLPHRIQVFTGPFIPESEFAQLQQAAWGRANITIRKFTPNLLAYMEKADLSISLGGYNTTMNVLRTGVKAMIYPSTRKREQLMRTQKLEKLGIVQMIRPDDLDPPHLAKKIINWLNQEPAKSADKSFDLEGAPKTASLLKELLNNQVGNTASLVAS